MGGFFRFLEQQKLLDDTVVIITSDHGDEFLEHGECDHKHSVYRELVHVPLIIRLPSKQRARVAPSVPAAAGILPTVGTILGFEAPGSQEHDLVRVVHGGVSPASVMSETGYLQKGEDGQESGWPLKYHKRSVTTPAHKLVYSWVKARESWELLHPVRRTDAGPGYTDERQRDAGRSRGCDVWISVRPE